MTGHPVRFAFVGKAGAGKTTLANYCIDKYKCEKVSFAGPLKQVAEIRDTLEPKDWGRVCEQIAFDLLGSSGIFHSDRRIKAEKLGKDWYEALHNIEDYRALLQFIGTDAGRGMDENIWVRKAANEIWKLGDETPLVVDDVRFVNESQMLRKKGFLIAKIDVPEDVRLGRLMDRDGFIPEGAWQKHASEMELDQIVPDVLIDNSEDDYSGATKSAAKVQIDEIVQERFHSPTEKEIPADGVAFVSKKPRWNDKDQLVPSNITFSAAPHFDPKPQEKVEMPEDKPALRLGDNMIKILDDLKETNLESVSYTATVSKDGSVDHDFTFVEQAHDDEE